MRLSRCLLPLALCLVLAQLAHAEAPPIVTCVEDAHISGGLWYYDFTLTNPTDSDAGAAWGFAIMEGPGLPGFLPGAVITGDASGWVPAGNGPDQHWTAPDPESELLPGAATMTGFRISSVGQLSESLTWRVNAVNPCEGQVEIEQANSGTPEPCSLLLLGLAAGPALAWRRRKVRLAKA
ncbi:MAG: PEP-CTERM sorting domain-containing protein [Armatimonadota bacterium]